MSINRKLENHYWHCVVWLINDNEDYVAFYARNLSREELKTQIVSQYNRGKPFFLEGCRIYPAQIDRISLLHTYRPVPAGSKLESDEESVYPKDYTAHLLDPEFTQEESKQTPPSQSTATSRDSSKVFVVHGRDEALKQTVCRFVENLGFEAIALSEKPNQGQTIIEKFEAHSDVGYAVVLLTPDDEGRLNAPAQTLQARARQNVIFELGFFFGKHGRENVCVLYKKGVELPSDVSGLAYHLADSHDAWKWKLGQEMKAAGLEIDMNKLS